MRLLRLTFVCATVIVGVVATPLAAGAQTTTSTTVPSLVPTNTNPGFALSGTGLVVFVAAIVGGLALLLFLPVLVGLLSSFRLQRNQQRFLESIAAKKDLQGDDLKSVLQSFERVSGTGASTGDADGNTNQSTTTSLLALATLMLVGFALVLVLVSSSSDATDLRKTIITALLSILASIAGFYFGARTAQQSAKQAQNVSGGSGDATQPAFVTATPAATATIGQPYAYEFRATGSPAPKYALVGAPPWLSIDAMSGSLSGVVPTGSNPFKYYVTATNGAGQTTAGPFDVSVLPAPTTPAPPPPSPAPSPPAPPAPTA